MTKPDDYRAKAQECAQMAAISRNPNEKAALLRMAQQWLGMIPKDAATDPLATGQIHTRQTKSE